MRPSELSNHPNRVQIQAVVQQVGCLSHAQLRTLASAWPGSGSAPARSRALSVDNPYILDVLAVFDDLDFARYSLLSHIDSGYIDELSVEQAHQGICAARDAVAAAHARPLLKQSEYEALLAPWVVAFGRSSDPSRRT